MRRRRRWRSGRWRRPDLLDAARGVDLRGQGRQQRGRRRVERRDASSRARRRHAQLRADRSSPYRRSAAGAAAASRRDRLSISAPRPSTTCAACWRRHTCSSSRASPNAISGRRIARPIGREPFVRIVKERTGLYRYPEPKILSGSNYADVGFELDACDGPRRRPVRDRQPDERRRRHRAAVRESDVGWDETTGLEFPGSIRS